MSTYRVGNNARVTSSQDVCYTPTARPCYVPRHDNAAHGCQPTAATGRVGEGETGRAVSRSGVGTDANQFSTACAMVGCDDLLRSGGGQESFRACDLRRALSRRDGVTQSRGNGHGLAGHQGDISPAPTRIANNLSGSTARQTSRIAVTFAVEPTVAVSVSGQTEIAFSANEGQVSTNCCRPDFLPASIGGLR